MSFTPNFLDLGAVASANLQPLPNFSRITNPMLSGPINAPLPQSKPASRGGIGGFFDHIEKATQSPLFGLGVGLLSGDPQQGFQNARSLSNDKSGANRSLSVSDLRQGLAKIENSGRSASELSNAELSSAFYGQ